MLPQKKKRALTVSVPFALGQENTANQYSKRQSSSFQILLYQEICNFKIFNLDSIHRSQAFQRGVTSHWCCYGSLWVFLCTI